MRLYWIVVAIFLGFIVPCHCQFSGLSMQSGKDLIKNMTDTEVFSLLGDVIFRNPSFTYIFHKLEAVPFSVGPLLSPPSLRSDILNNILLWALDRLPSWVENPHLVNAYHILVKNINAVNTTGLPSGPNDYSKFVIGLFNRTDFVKVIKEILKSEGANITDMIGLEPGLAQIILPWTIDNVANIVKTDGPVLLKILVQKLNAVNMTGINTSDPTDVLNGIRMRFNYLELASLFINDLQRIEYVLQNGTTDSDAGHLNLTSAIPLLAKLLYLYNAEKDKLVPLVDDALVCLQKTLETYNVSFDDLSKTDHQRY